jgi:hypothetical protein
MLAIKYSLRFFLIILLIIHFTGCVTYQEAVPPASTRKDDTSIIGFSLSSTCGIAKEINDEARRNNWSYKDLLWDFI